MKGSGCGKEASSAQAMSAASIEDDHLLNGNLHTTIMVRNLPRKVLAADLLAELENYISRKHFDFVSVPWDRKSPSNLGFAFVNFSTPQMAAKAHECMDGQVWRAVASTKRIKIVAARIQGLRKNILHCIGVMSPELNEKSHPLIFIRGQQVNFHVAVNIATQQVQQQQQVMDTVPGLQQHSEMRGRECNQDEGGAGPHRPSSQHQQQQ
eukprot:CAMPEP_0206613702 /NCGR_PEP_ID=MMETSP0325_2-20121206/56889_1 /ASSEMBLY_ACC=CAM_ASM_000347 /TAXON_ID=2866 /ORGANISM="Crypthecodinium cohnii, Strain Seligo" /LENGTH=208 /DNA_ID=CAMNT_0054133929 /DNA_START=45 /DNA_END=668 /DNA_ORIENTATION=+